MGKKKSKIVYYPLIHRADVKSSREALDKLGKRLNELKKQGMKAGIAIEEFPESKRHEKGAQIVYNALAKSEEEYKKKLKELGGQFVFDKKNPIHQYAKLKLQKIKGSKAIVIIEPYSKKAHHELRMWEAALGAAREAYKDGNYAEYMRMLKITNRHLAKHMKARDVPLLKRIKKVVEKNPGVEIHIERGGGHPLYNMLKEELGKQTEMVLHQKPMYLTSLHEVASKRARGLRVEEKEERRKLARSLITEELSSYIHPEQAKNMTEHLTELEIKDIMTTAAIAKPWDRGRVFYDKIRELWRKKNPHSPLAL